MSVLKTRRKVSRADFVNLAHKIYTYTFCFMFRVSKRYARVISPIIIQLASEVVDYCEKANSVYANNQVRFDLRESYLLQARASLMALDVKMADVYLILRQNPQGAFTTANKKLVDPPKAMQKIEKMAQGLGSLIDKENGYLINLLKSDKRRGLLPTTIPSAEGAENAANM